MATGSGTSLRARILGVPVDLLSLPEALDAAWRLGASARPGRPALVLTPNPELIMQARAEADLRAVLEAADLCLADGVGVVWAARRRGLAVPGRVPGIDLFQALLGRAAAEGWPVYLLGARADVVAAAARRAAERFPGLRVAGAADGYFAARGEEAAVVAAVARSGARLLFVGLGVPAQERFLYRHRGEFGAVRLGMGVGGSFDVLSGFRRRAPEAVRRLGLEWLWRLGREPSRWRRQLALPRFALAVLRER
jgi:N-acetylglucosaminyldiphosphoundecaprenol N-acetyl-beta-D-mannosaminyltransferase